MTGLVRVLLLAALTVRPATQQLREHGRRRGRTEAVAFLRAQASAHHGQVGDHRRRGALNHAADRLEQGRGVGRP